MECAKRSLHKNDGHLLSFRLKIINIFWLTVDGKRKRHRYLAFGF